MKAQIHFKLHKLPVCKLKLPSSEDTEEKKSPCVNDACSMYELGPKRFVSVESHL